jgi:hypothetical protein
MAALATSPQKTAWKENDDGLEDDVATLSYERALRTHARYKDPQPSDQAFTRPAQAFTQPLDPDVLRFCEAIPDEETLDTPLAAPRQEPALEAAARITPAISNAHGRNVKSASITIRLSKAECDQLRTRAAEAGLTVSAYLRSCTFETESLRALVKDTLAQLRNANTPDEPKPRSPARSPRFAWLQRLLPHPQHRPAVARA